MLRKCYDRLAGDATFRKMVLLTIGFGVALAAEVVVLAVDVPRHQRIFLHVAVSLAVFLLPLTMVAIIARSPFGKKFTTQRFVIRPFLTLRSKSNYDGNAIASLLFREIVASRSRAKGSMEGRIPGYSMPNAVVSLGLTSLPIDWIWTITRYLITGKKDIIIEGILIDCEPSFLLIAWASNRTYTRQAAFEDRPFAEALPAAITSLTTQLLESLDPIKLAAIYRNQWRFDEAARLLTDSESSLEQQMELIYVKFEGECLSETERLLQQAMTRIKVGSNSYFTAQRILAMLLTHRGKFDQSRAVLRETLRDRRCKPTIACGLHPILADTFAFEGKYREAVAAYDEAMRVTIAALGGLTGDRSLSKVSDFADRGLQGTVRAEVVNVLLARAYTARNRSLCKEKCEEDPYEDLRSACEAIDKVRTLVAPPSPIHDLEAALLASAIANYHFKNNNHDLLRTTADEAVQLYGSAVAVFEQWLSQTANDLQLVANLAWSYYGKACCLSRTLSADLPQNDEEQLHAAVKCFARRISILSAASLNTISIHFQRARELAPSKNDKYLERVRQAALNASRALLSQFGSEALLITRELDLEVKDEETYEDQSVDSQIAALTKENSAQSALDSEDLRNLYLTLCKLLNRMCLHEHSEEIDNWLNTGETEGEVDNCFRRCDELFGNLALAHKRAAAESAYGFACRSAMKMDNETATKRLVQAGEIAGENTLAYLNRATLDSNLDGVSAR